MKDKKIAFGICMMIMIIALSATALASTSIKETSENQTGFYTGGTERMRIDNNGKVGIGTATPNMTLDVNGTISVGSASNSSGYSQFGPVGTLNNIGSDRLAVSISSSGNVISRAIIAQSEFNGTNTDAGTYQGINSWSGTSASSNGSLTNVNSGGALRSRYVIKHQGNGSVALASAVSGLIWSTGNGNINDSAVYNAESPIINSGTTWRNHSALWIKGGAVSGTLTNRFGILIENLSGGTNRWGIYQAGTSDKNLFAGNTSFSSRVGIGTATPSQKLEVNGSANITGDVYIYPDPNNRATSFIKISNITKEDGTTTPSIGIGTDTPARTISIKTNQSAGQFEINHTGNGTTDYAGILMWNDGGKFFTLGLASSKNNVTGRTPNNTFIASDSALTFSTGNSYNERMRITNDGKIGIMTPTPSQTLEVNGSANITQSVYTSKVYSDGILAIENNGTHICFGGCT